MSVSRLYNITAKKDKIYPITFIDKPTTIIEILSGESRSKSLKELV